MGMGRRVEGKKAEKGGPTILPKKGTESRLVRFS
jgi:hypothetical protein